MIEVPRFVGKRFEEPPLSWHPFKDSDGYFGAIFTCPNGHTGTLVSTRSGTHEIDDQGVISPSVVCDIDGCTFHDHIRLLEWSHLRWREDSNQEGRPQ